MTDIAQLESRIINMRSELQTLSQRTEVFGVLPPHVREPIIDRLAVSLLAVSEHIQRVRDAVEQEIARQRGDEADEYRQRFRQASGG